MCRHPGVTVLSTTALSGREGCHYAWERGYRELGDQVFDVVAHDIYGGPGSGVAAPNPRSAAFTDARRTEVVVQLRNPDPLTVQPGARAPTSHRRRTATVTGVEYREGGRLLLSLSGPADGATRCELPGRRRGAVVSSTPPGSVCWPSGASR